MCSFGHNHGVVSMTNPAFDTNYQTGLNLNGQFIPPPLSNPSYPYGDTLAHQPSTSNSQLSQIYPAQENLQVSGPYCSNPNSLRNHTTMYPPPNFPQPSLSQVSFPSPQGHEVPRLSTQPTSPWTLEADAGRDIPQNLATQGQQTSDIPVPISQGYLLNMQSQYPQQDTSLSEASMEDSAYAWQHGGRQDFGPPTLEEVQLWWANRESRNR